MPVIEGKPTPLTPLYTLDEIKAKFPDEWEYLAKEFPMISQETRANIINNVLRSIPVTLSSKNEIVRDIHLLRSRMIDTVGRIKHAG